MKLFRSIRTTIFTLTALLIIGIIAGVIGVVPSPQLQIIRLTQLFAFLAIIYLYLTLLVSPLYTVLPFLPYKIHYTKARRALGISAFFFGLLHASLAFFGQLGGFQGLFFLNDTYLLAISLSFTALFILAVMAITANNKMTARLTYPKWKRLHRLVYLAGTLILIHALMLGTQFQDLSGVIPQITFVLLVFLLILEAIRFDRYLIKRYPHRLPQFGISLVVILVMVSVYSLASFLPASSLSLGIHAQHILLAQQAQNPSLPSTSQSIPGLNGDPNLRYTMSFLHVDDIQPNQDTSLHFKTYNAATGEEIKLFSLVYTKIVHLVIVDESLNYFAHIHPTQDENGFVVTTSFPHAGKYHLYLDYQPLGAIEQQTAFSLSVGESERQAIQPAMDARLIKTFGDYTVALSFPEPLKAAQLSIGQQKMTFTITNAKTKKPLKTLKPYLAAFGHLVMINEKTFEYVHVHPTNLIPPAPDANGGPTVEFLPLGLYGPIKPGIYRVFAQFNPDNHLFTADFTVKIE